MIEPLEGGLVDIEVLVADVFLGPVPTDLGALLGRVGAGEGRDVVDGVEPPLEVDVAEEGEEVLRRAALFVHELPDLRPADLVDDLVLVVDLDHEDHEPLRRLAIAELVDH